MAPPYPLFQAHQAAHKAHRAHQAPVGSSCAGSTAEVPQSHQPEWAEQGTHEAQLCVPSARPCMSSEPVPLLTATYSTRPQAKKIQGGKVVHESNCQLRSCIRRQLSLFFSLPSFVTQELELEFLVIHRPLQLSLLAVSCSASSLAWFATSNSTGKETGLAPCFIFCPRRIRNPHDVI